MLNPVGVYPDGLAFDGYVAAVPQLHPACEFKFRPMLAEEVRALAGQIQRQSPEDGQVTVAQYIGDRIESWSLRGVGDAVVPPSPEMFRRICPELADKLSGIVQGYRPSDRKPDGTEPTSGLEQLRESEKN